MIHLTLEGSCFGADLQAFLVSRGQFFRIVVSKAPQVGDLNLWNVDEPEKTMYRRRSVSVLAETKEELFLFCRRHAALMRRREENMSRLARSMFVAALSFIFIGAALRPIAAEEPYKVQLDALRKSLEKYQDYRVAVRDLYLSTVGCVHYSGEKIPHHMEYPKGAMGVHFVNLTVQGAPDPMKPNVLIYEPVGKELKLVAVEWLVPLTADTKQRPSLFGQPFMGPMEGHEPLIPKEFVHYDLHAWLFKDNPLGMFAPTNPYVSCEGSDFSLLEKPTMMVQGP